MKSFKKHPQKGKKKNGKARDDRRGKKRREGAGSYENFEYKDQTPEVFYKKLAAKINQKLGRFLTAFWNLN